MHLLQLPIVAALVLLVGCEANETAKPGDSGAGLGDSGTGDTGDEADSADSGGCDSDDVDTGAHGSPVGLCSDGGWGALGGHDGVIHVSATGSSAGTGHWWDPVATIDEALALSACDGRTNLLVGPGSFAAHADLPDGGGLYGCGAEVTTLVGDVDSPDYVVRVDGGTGVVLADFATTGGRRALLFQGGEATVEHVTVTGSAQTGILGFGGPQLTLNDVWVLGSIPEETETVAYAPAYGLSVQGADGSDAGRANVSMEGGGIRAATVAGIIVDTTVLSLVGVEVSGTLPSIDEAGVATFGRGVEVQAWSSATLDGCTLASNYDAALFSSGSQSLTVTDSTITQVTASTVSATDSTATGDGIVVIRGDGAYDVDQYHLSVSGGTIEAVDRAAVLAEDVTVDLMAPDDRSTGVGLVYQGTETTGAAIDSGQISRATSELGYNKDILAVDPSE